MIASEGLSVDLESLAPEDLEYMLGLAYQRYVGTSALIGSPESCTPIVERMREIGVDEIAWPGGLRRGSRGGDGEPALARRAAGSEGAAPEVSSPSRSTCR